MKEDLKEMRESYMGLTKDVVMEAVRREHVVTIDLCSSCNDAGRTEALKDLAKSNQKLAGLCDRVRLLERQAKGKLGVPALFPTDLSNTLRVALAFLSARMLTETAARDTRTVTALADMAAAGDPTALLEVHDAFRQGGVMRPHVMFDYGRTVGEMTNPTLTEGAFCRLLALADDVEMAELERARMYVRRSR